MYLPLVRLLGLAAKIDLANVPGPAPASRTTKFSGFPKSVHLLSIQLANTAPKSGPTSGLVMKSPLRPAEPLEE